MRKREMKDKRENLRNPLIKDDVKTKEKGENCES